MLVNIWVIKAVHAIPLFTATSLSHKQNVCLGRVSKKWNQAVT